MPMNWRSRSKKSYKIDFSDDESDASSPPPSRGSSHRPQPKPQQLQASRTMISSGGTKRPCKMVSSSSDDSDAASDPPPTTSSLQNDSKPESDQDQPVTNSVAASGSPLLTMTPQIEPTPEPDQNQTMINSVAASGSPLLTMTPQIESRPEPDQDQPMIDSVIASGSPLLIITPQIESKPEPDQNKTMIDSAAASGSPLLAMTPQIESRPEPDQDQPMIDSVTASGSPLATRSSPQMDTKLETHQDQPVVDSDFDSCTSIYDADLGQRNCARINGENKPVLQWEIMSREYHRWIHRMEKYGPEPVIENLEVHEPSADVILPLLRYQKEWLSWGLRQEASEMKGGILADEMGMGKTMQAISLVLTARDLYARTEASSSSSKGDNKCTLVICPVVALLQWRREIEKHTVDGCVKIFVYYGGDRLRGELDFSPYDFVLTSFSTVEMDYRKYAMPPKEICTHCGGRFANVKTLSKHQRYLLHFLLL